MELWVEWRMLEENMARIHYVYRMADGEYLNSVRTSEARDWNIIASAASRLTILHKHRSV